MGTMLIIAALCLVLIATGLFCLLTISHRSGRDQDDYLPIEKGK